MQKYRKKLYCILCREQKSVTLLNCFLDNFYVNYPIVVRFANLALNLSLRSRFLNGNGYMDSAVDTDWEYIQFVEYATPLFACYIYKPLLKILYSLLIFLFYSSFSLQSLHHFMITIIIMRNVCAAIHVV